MPSAPDAIPICGGADTRLRQIIGGAPKSLASIGGRPFIHLLLHQVWRHGIQPVILAVRYHPELIRSHRAIKPTGWRLNIRSSELRWHLGERCETQSTLLHPVPC